MTTVPDDHIQRAKEDTKTQNRALKLKGRTTSLGDFSGKVGLCSLVPLRQGQVSSTS